ncbi:SAM-dependent methyltransferase [Portibacter marinus]|uniref:SAM-dependent methyltransferase n=1 Tax=Portibacter marinus TaxID=2898660 RepID=UPI001F3D27DD|nr:SAM-dependent methyltransferase [Portibacter marinus]
MIQSGTLHLFPCPIIDGEISTIPESVIKAIRKIDFFIAERAKTARRFLKQIEHPLSFDQIEIFELDKKNPLEDKDDWLTPLMSGKEIGLLSEAGTPCIADPGEKITSWAHQIGAKVKPYVGPNSILLALIASGLNGEQFHFHTYLPIHQNEINKALKSIGTDIQKNGTSHIFIETPYRNLKTFDTILKSLPSSIYLCIATDITGAYEIIKTQTLKDWKASRKPDLHKRPTVFILGVMQ